MSFVIDILYVITTSFGNFLVGYGLADLYSEYQNQFYIIFSLAGLLLIYGYFRSR